MFKFNGTLKVKNDTVQVSEKFTKREFVVTDTSSMYPQDIQFQLAQDKCSLLDSFNEGDAIEVSFNLRGKSWVNPQGETKYFNTLDAWRIEGGVANPNNSAPIEKSNAMAPNPDWQQPFVPGQATNDIGDDDLSLPF